MTLDLREPRIAEPAAPPPVRRADGRARVLVPVAVLAVAAALRVWNLGFPERTIADESYYATDASNYLGGGVTYVPAPFETIPEEGTWMHPPLGKELIALGVGPLGARPIGWRVPPAVAGVVTVLLVYLLALRLWRSVAWAGLAALLVAVDGIEVVLSRLAMLDIFLTMFVLAGFLFVARSLSADRAEDPPWTARFGGRDLVLAGAMFGGALAVKWSGAFALAAAVGLVLAERRTPRAVAWSFAAVPLAIYLAAYFPFWLAHGPDLAAFVRLHGHMLARQLGTTTPNPVASSPLSWPLMLEPLVAYPRPTGAIASDATRIVAVGNPVLWWAFLAAAPVAGWAALRRGDLAARIALLGYLSLWTPWLLFGRTEYLYYMTPAVPFMALALVAGVRALGRPAARIGAGVAIAAGVAAVAFAPVWLGIHVSPGWYRALELLPGWR